MVEIAHRLGGWPRTDDRLDPVFAISTSMALHLLALLLLLVGGLGSGTSARPSFQGASDVPTSTLDASEFRQRLVLVSFSLPSKKVPTTTTTKIEPLPSEEDPSPAPTSEQPLDAQIEIGTKQARTADSAKKASTTDVSESTAAAPLDSQAQEANANSTSGGGSSDSLRTAYLAALRTAIQGKWSVNPDHHGNCSVTVRQTIGGNVASAIATDCKLDESDRMALEAAALMAQPLPYAGFESVFSDDVLLEMSN